MTMPEQGPTPEIPQTPEQVVAKTLRDALRNLRDNTETPEAERIGDIIRKAEDFTSATTKTPWAETDKGPVAEGIVGRLSKTPEWGSFTEVVEVYRTIQKLEGDNRR